MIVGEREGEAKTREKERKGDTQRKKDTERGKERKHHSTGRGDSTITRITSRENDEEVRC